MESELEKLRKQYANLKALAEEAAFHIEYMAQALCSRMIDDDGEDEEEAESALSDMVTLASRLRQ